MNGLAVHLKAAAQRAVEKYRYHFARAHEDEPNYGLGPHQVYPAGKNIEQFYLRDSVAEPAERFITPQTPVSSLGACFGEQFKYHLKRRGFNYLQTENNPASVFCSCGWGRVVTTQDLRQVFDYTFGELQANSRLYETDLGRRGKKVIDPYRDLVVYDSLAEAQKSLEEHEAASKRALTECRALIVTIGQNEGWINQADGLAFTHRPPDDLREKMEFSLEQYTLEDNIANLDKVAAYVERHNPDCRIIVSVSPVPSWVTFGDTNVVDRSFLNKAILIVAVRAWAHKHAERVSYFPAYEMLATIRNSYKSDNRHIMKHAVLRTMSAFDRAYCLPE